MTNNKNLLQLQPIIFSLNSTVPDKGHIIRYHFLTFSLLKIKRRIAATQKQPISQPLCTALPDWAVSPLPSPAPETQRPSPFPSHRKALAHLTISPIPAERLAHKPESHEERAKWSREGLIAASSDTVGSWLSPGCWECPEVRAALHRACMN